jgi:hypothetical protein
VGAWEVGTVTYTATWAEKIRPAIDRALDDQKPTFEVLVDGHRFVSLLTVDLVGDNTLVYMTRAETRRLIRKLQKAVDALPNKSKP